MIDKTLFEGHTSTEANRSEWLPDDIRAINKRLRDAAPSLLLENTKLCELVRAQQELIDWLDGGAMVGDFSIRARINALKDELGLNE